MKRLAIFLALLWALIGASTGGRARGATSTPILPTTADTRTWLETPSSANLATAVTGETGSGALVFGTSPTIAAPTITGAEARNGTTTFLTSSLGTAYQPLVLDTNDPAAPYFGASIRSEAGVNGATTRDNVYAFSWNMGASGTRVDTNLPAFQWILESDYTSPAPIRQMEHYINFVAADGSDYRPWGIDFHYSTENLIGAWRCDQINIGKKDNSTDWLVFNSTDVAGYNLYFQTGTASYIDYRGSATSIFRISGNELLGFTSSKPRIAASYNDIGIAENFDPLSETISLKLGVRTRTNLGWMRWFHTNQRWEFMQSDGLWRPFGVPTEVPHNVSTGTLATTAGAYSELGYLNFLFTYNHMARVDLVIPGNCAQSYIIVRGSPDVTGSSWYEAIPLRGENEGDVALDVKPNGTGQRMDLRVRRKSAVGTTQAFRITITGLGADVDFTANASTGTGATIAGVYRNSVTAGLAPVSNATATRTLTAADCVGQICTNTGDADAQVNNLPDAQAGLRVTFSLTAAQDIDINAATGDQILGLTNATGDAISSDATIGSHITLVAVDATNWVVVASAGTWTDVN